MILTILYVIQRKLCGIILPSLWLKHLVHRVLVYTTHSILALKESWSQQPRIFESWACFVLILRNGRGPRWKIFSFQTINPNIQNRLTLKLSISGLVYMVERSWLEDNQDFFEFVPGWWTPQINLNTTCTCMGQFTPNSTCQRPACLRQDMIC